MNKKFLSLIFFGLLVFNLMLVLADPYTVGGVDPVTGDPTTPTSSSSTSVPTDAIKSWFMDWQNGNFSSNIAKYLFWALISMAVYSIGKRLPVFNSMFKGNLTILGIAFSIIIGFLSMAYITPSEVYAIMVSYSAMGFVLAGVIPFIILLTFTFTLTISENGETATEIFFKKMIAVLMWAVFVVFIGIKLFSKIGAPKIGVWNIFEWAIFLLAILFLFLVIKRRGIFEWSRRKLNEIRAEEFKQGSKKARLSRREAARDVDMTFGDPPEGED